MTAWLSEVGYNELLTKPQIQLIVSLLQLSPSTVKRHLESVSVDIHIALHTKLSKAHVDELCNSVMCPSVAVHDTTEAIFFARPNVTAEFPVCSSVRD